MDKISAYRIAFYWAMTVKLISQELVDQNPETQSGFRSGHSCSTALLNVTDSILRALDEGLCTILVLLDYSKAFDTLNHQTLGVILRYIGLDPSAISFFDNYLHNRRQRVVMEGSISEYSLVSRGVPQGSVLGPILYNIYTSAFPGFLLNCKTQMYADDTQLFYSFQHSKIQEACNLINKDLNILNRISQEHCLQLNPAKCVSILFGRPVPSQFQLKINDVCIPVRKEVKSLGVIVDERLRFESHISLCIKKSISILKLLYDSRHFLDSKTKRLLCDSLVLSVFNYCDVVYGPCLTSATAQRIQKVQKCCLRFIYGIRRRQRVSYKLKEAGWLDMKTRRFFHRCVLFHKIIVVKCPRYLYLKITFRTDVHNLNLRFKGTLTPPAHRTATFERSFTYDIAKTFNSLSDPLKSLSIFSFRKYLKRQLLCK